MYTTVKNIIGVEMNKEFCLLQENVIKKFRLRDRIKASILLLMLDLLHKLFLLRYALYIKFLISSPNILRLNTPNPK